MDKTITCPYNRAHQIRPERIQYHLIKCRKQFPEKTLQICPFNATHHVSKPELRTHMTECPDRRILDVQRYKFNEPMVGHHGDLSNPKVYGSSKIPKEVVPNSSGQQPEVRERPKLRPRGGSTLGSGLGTSVMDTTSASSIGRDYLKKANKCDFLQQYVESNERPGFGTAAPKTPPSRRKLNESRVGGGLDDFRSMASSLAEVRSGRRRRSASGERKPLRRPKTDGSGDAASVGSGIRPVTPTSTNYYISDRG